MPNAFVINDDVRYRARMLQRYAENRQNWFYPKNPQDRDPVGKQYDIQSGDVRAVLTFTFHEGRVYRHMRVSVPRGYPEPVFVWTMAYLLGFKTPEPDEEGLVRDPNRRWTAAGPDPKRRCIDVLEEVSGKVLD